VSAHVDGLTPPVAPRRPHPVELHGERREDDYFWLRERDNPEVRAYLEAETAYAEAAMAPTKPLQERLYAEMLGRIQETDSGVPFRFGSHWYYTRTEEGKQYSIHCRRAGSPGGSEQIILDVNLLAKGQPYMSLGALAMGPTEQLLAYSTDNVGYHDYRLHVRDLQSGRDLPFDREKVSSVAWAAEGRTLFYVVEDAAKRPCRLYRHILGQSGPDELLLEETNEMFRLFVTPTRSRRWLLVYAASHTTGECRILDAATPLAPWRLVAERVQDIEYDVDHLGDHLYLRINDTGRNFRLVRGPVDEAFTGAWEEVVPHRADVMLENAELFRDHLVLSEREDGLPYLRVVPLAGGEGHRVSFPEPAYSVHSTDNREQDTAILRYEYESLVTPASVFDYDMNTREVQLLKRSPVLGGYDPGRFVTERLHATAADGTRVPVSVVRRRDLERPAPLLLYGYGSYGISMPAGFSSNRVSLLERGVAFAIAHVRGGGEIGKPWHDQGRMLHKRNTFTDFVAVAEHLIARGDTRPDRLVIQGGSAGGLLMGAVVNARPDLFKAVVSQVPFVDVLNSMSDASLPLTAGEWEEWGDPRRKEHYDAIRAYCPYSNLSAQAYPSMLVKTSLFDSQVMYWEPAKYVARLRQLKTDANTLLFHVNLEAGHHGASGRYDYLREIAFDYAFVLTQVGRVA
jgi:oligopeptidase B